MNVQFELMDDVRTSVLRWLKLRGGSLPIIRPTGLPANMPAWWIASSGAPHAAYRRDDSFALQKVQQLVKAARQDFEPQ